MKFSQVEFVAVVSTLLEKYVVEPVGPWERLKAALAEPSDGSPTLNIGKKEEVVLRLLKVEKSSQRSD
jgi:hypothetical protein